MYPLVFVVNLFASAATVPPSFGSSAATLPLKTSPFVPSTVNRRSSDRALVALPVPTTHGTPSSLLTIAAWLVIPPSSVTIPAAFIMAGEEAGGGILPPRGLPAPHPASFSGR